MREEADTEERARRSKDSEVVDENIIIGGGEEEKEELFCSNSKSHVVSTPQCLASLTYSLLPKTGRCRQQHIVYGRVLHVYTTCTN